MTPHRRLGLKRSMRLAELVAGLAEHVPDIEVSGLALDSRLIKPGFAFIAVNGARQHGMEHVEQALANGAVAVVFDPAGGGKERAERLNRPLLLEIAQLSEKLGPLAARFYRHPSRELTVVGITGTNGKTSCSQFLAQLVPHCGVIGTMGWGGWGDLRNTVNTTPDALAVQEILRRLRDDGKRTVAMEVSSHGLEQGRANGIAFSGALFTNLSRDHLDYHGTMEDYLAAKIRLFTWPGLQFAVLNLDDPYAAAIIERIGGDVKTWGFAEKATARTGIDTVRAENVVHSLDGVRFEACWREQRVAVKTAIAGGFNLENLLAVLTVLLAMGLPLQQAAERLEQLRPVAGRMENFGGHDKPTVFVDYAHSPDALDKLLAGLRPHCRGCLRVVFGCGGDRDRGKRAQMGGVAERWADDVILTDDNPRSERPEAIVNDILTGCDSAKVSVIHDRKQAITTVIKRARREDCVVIAGKGHEHYQDVNGVRLPFSDQRVVKQALVAWGDTQ